MINSFKVIPNIAALALASRCSGIGKSLKLIVAMCLLSFDSVVAYVSSLSKPVKSKNTTLFLHQKIYLESVLGFVQYSRQQEYGNNTQNPKRYGGAMSRPLTPLSLRAGVFSFVILISYLQFWQSCDFGKMSQVLKSFVFKNG